MTFTEQTNGTTADATEINKLATYYDKVSSTSTHSTTSAAWVTAETFTDVKVKSSDSYVKGVYAKITFSAATYCRYSIKLVGTNSGTTYVSPSYDEIYSTNDWNYGGQTLSSSQLTAGTKNGSGTAEVYVPLPPGHVTGDSTYDITIEYGGHTPGNTQTITAIELKLYSSDDLVTELT